MQGTDVTLDELRTAQKVLRVLQHTATEREAEVEAMRDERGHLTSEQAGESFMCLGVRQDSSGAYSHVTRTLENLEALKAKADEAHKAWLVEPTNGNCVKAVEADKALKRAWARFVC